MNYDLNHLPRFDAVQGGKVIYMRNGKRMERALPGKGKGKKVGIGMTGAGAGLAAAAALTAGGVYATHKANKYKESEHGQAQLKIIAEKNEKLKGINQKLESNKQFNKAVDKERQIAEKLADLDTPVNAMLKKERLQKAYGRIKTYSNQYDKDQQFFKDLRKKERAQAIGEAFKGYGRELIGKGNPSSKK